MDERAELEDIIRGHGFDDFKWIEPGGIVVAQWVRAKCVFGCPEHGRVATCPPNVPSVSECGDLFSEYSEIALLHLAGTVDRPEDRHAWTRKINARLVKLERAVFLAGYHKALVLFIDPCNFCDECVPQRTDCKIPQNARPSPEALAVDVFSTARNCGYDIHVLKEYSESMNRFGMLLVE